MAFRTPGFNPCSGGSIALGRVSHPSDSQGWHTFQSLFWWKYCPGPIRFNFQVRGDVKVSILVLVEVLPWASSASLPDAVQWVSILVLVEVLPWESCGCWAFFSLCVVSILVLVEVLPWAWIYPSGLLGSCFNPCSGGSIALGVTRSFSSAHTRSFNPCSGGSIALGSVDFILLPPKDEVSILVLVEVLPWAVVDPPRNFRMFCFNPCSGGSIALGIRRDAGSR